MTIGAEHFEVHFVPRVVKLQHIESTTRRPLSLQFSVKLQGELK